MIVRLRDHTGATVLINSDHVVMGGQACEPPPALTPILGFTVLVMVNGANIQVRGTPEQVYGEIRRVDGRALIAEPNGKRVDD